MRPNELKKIREKITTGVEKHLHQTDGQGYLWCPVKQDFFNYESSARHDYLKTGDPCPLCQQILGEHEEEKIIIADGTSHHPINHSVFNN